MNPEWRHTFGTDREWSSFIRGFHSYGFETFLGGQCLRLAETSGSFEVVFLGQVHHLPLSTMALGAADAIRLCINFIRSLNSALPDYDPPGAPVSRFEHILGDA